MGSVLHTHHPTVTPRVPPVPADEDPSAMVTTSADVSGAETPAGRRTLGVPGAAVTLAHKPLGTQSRVLPRESESSSVARNFVADVLKDWGLASVQDDAALVVTELVNNAIRHTGTPRLRVTVCRMSPGKVRIGVIDRRPALVPDLRCAGPLDTSGRGLALVDALTRAWGYTRWPWAKCVWADIEAPDAS
ncbi:ATP-binding protein [Streptomyces sp. NPDC052721]|uniref:ATP-binding protein n=1 Tax=Streptomyces sp. NPDC052721 TaxID=3154955 RepID=UPI00344A265F